MKKKKITDEIIESSKVDLHPIVKPENFITTGCTTLNLALTDNKDCGFALGGMVNIIGDSSSGKTFLSLTILAEANANPNFDDYELIYDDAENRNNFDLAYLFGKSFSKRIQPAFGYDDDGQPINSETIEDFQDAIWKKLNGDKPFIYILDSMDSLDCEADIIKFEDTMKVRDKIRNGKDVKTPAGNYGMSKAKQNSEMLRRICGKLKNTNSLLIIISQTRDNIGLGFAEKTRAGGRALKFYANHELWLATVKTHKKKELPVGVQTRCKIKKNSITGKIRTADIQIFYDYGIDDVSSMVDFLLETKHWTKTGRTINAEELSFKGVKEKLIEYIEENAKEKRLKSICNKVWMELEDSVKTKRKRKYE